MSGRLPLEAPSPGDVATTNKHLPPVEVAVAAATEEKTESRARRSAERPKLPPLHKCKPKHFSDNYQRKLKEAKKKYRCTKARTISAKPALIGAPAPPVRLNKQEKKDDLIIRTIRCSGNPVMQARARAHARYNPPLPPPPPAGWHAPPPLPPPLHWIPTTIPNPQRFQWG